MTQKLSPVWSYLTAFVILGGPALAAPVDSYYSGGPYKCDQATMVAEWRLSGDTDSDLKLETYTWRLDRAGSSVKGQSWSVPAASLAGPLDLSDSNGRAYLRVSGFLENRPKVVALNRKGEARTDCDINIAPAETPRARYDEVLTLLDTPEPHADVALLVNPAIDRLPPINLLPELEQGTTQNAVKEKRSAFWDRYRQTSLSRADDPQDKELIEGIDQLLAAAKSNSQRQWHADLLSDVQARRAAAIYKVGGDTKAGAISESAFCQRLADLPDYYDYDKYLMTATNVPVLDWDESFAQSYLDIAANCDKGKGFSQTVTSRWPAIQKMQAGSRELDARVARLQNLPLSLASVAAENWFEISYDQINEYGAKGLDERAVRNKLEPALKQLRENAVPVLVAELAQGIETAEMADIPQWCETKTRNVFDGWKQPALLKKVTEECEANAVDLWKTRGLKVIEARKEELEALEPSVDNLFRYNFFSLEGTLPPSNQMPRPFWEARADLEIALTDAEQALAPKRQAAIRDGRAEISAVFEQAGPLDPENTAAEFCSPILNNFDRRFAEFRNACLAEMEQLSARKTKEKCNAVWEDIEAPDGFREGKISSPFRNQPVSVEKLICSPDIQSIGLTIKDDSGFFSSQYLLVNEKVVGGTPVRFTAVLTEPTKEVNEWTLRDATLNDAELNGPDYKTSADFMRCAIFLEECFRNN